MPSPATDPHSPPSPVAAPLPRRREAFAIASLALTAFALNLNTSVLGALLPFLPEDLAARKTSLLAAAAAGSAVGALWVLGLSLRFGRRQVLLAGLAVFVLASTAHLFATGWVALLVVRALSGIAVGVAYASASALVAAIVPYERRGAAMGMFTAGMFLAIPIGMPLSVLLARAGLWQWVFAAQAVIAGVGLLLALRSVPASQAREPRGSFVAVLRNAPALAALAATMLHVGSFFTTVQLATTWLDRTGRVPRDQQMWLWVGLGVASVLGSAGLGRVSDRVGKRNFVLVTSAILAACFVLLAREPESMVLLGCGAVLALVAAARTGPLQALASGAVPQDQLSTVMALRAGSMQVGVVGFAAAAGPVVDQFGFRGVLLLGAVCQVASYLVIRWFGREGR
ncbi:MAG: MFS transporter [Planctomycetes bacterium]|nr:MFS transporter [Planctomycetota bacterium]